MYPFTPNPTSNTPIAAPDFEVLNHYRIPTSLDMLNYGRGLLLAFIGDIWQPANVRRIIWLQRHMPKFMALDVSLALIAHDQPHTLYSFQVSNPMPTLFPLLADEDGAIRKLYQMEQGIVLIDPDFMIRAAWTLDEDRVWIKMNDIAAALDSLQYAGV